MREVLALLILSGPVARHFQMRLDLVFWSMIRTETKEILVEFQNQLAVLDRAIALSRVGGDAELLQEMAQLFLEECPSQMEAVRDAVQTRDPKAIERSAHSLKGSVGNFGAAAAHHAAFELEMKGRLADLRGVEQALFQLESAVDDLQPEMESLAQSAL